VGGGVKFCICVTVKSGLTLYTIGNTNSKDSRHVRIVPTNQRRNLYSSKTKHSLKSLKRGIFHSTSTSTTHVKTFPEKNNKQHAPFPTLVAGDRIFWIVCRIIKRHSVGFMLDHLTSSSMTSQCKRNGTQRRAVQYNKGDMKVKHALLWSEK
jgi:hypothetical protein